MSGDDGKGRLLLLSTALVLAAAGGAAWVFGESARGRALFEAQTAALRELLPQVSKQVELEATSELAGDILQGGGHGRSETDSETDEEWTIEIMRVGKAAEASRTLVSLRIHVEMHGWIRKRLSGIRAEPSGAAWDARFLDRLRGGLRARGLDRVVDPAP